ncbi:antibiotic biosynthesis monooxygenase, partial [Burkholderia sp. Bp9031]
MRRPRRTSHHDPFASFTPNGASMILEMASLDI